MLKAKISKWKYYMLISLFSTAFLMASGQNVINIESDVYTLVDQPAIPISEDVIKFLQRNIKYPSVSRRMKETGKVFVAMIVEKDGTITNPQIAQQVSPSLDAEALRVASLLTSWRPAKKNGEIVRMKILLPIEFILDKVEHSKQVSPEPEGYKMADVIVVGYTTIEN